MWGYKDGGVVRRYLAVHNGLLLYEFIPSDILE